MGFQPFEGPRVEEHGFFVTVTDLSAKQYHVVKLDTGNEGQVVIASDGDADIPYGVLQNNPKGASGDPRECSVMRKGVSKIVVGAAVTFGMLLGFNDSGRAIQWAGAGSYLLGECLSGAGADGDVATVSLGLPNGAVHS